MKIILFIIIGLIALTIFTFIFPLIIGGFIAYLCFSGGSIGSGIVVSLIALLWQFGIFAELGVLDGGLSFGGHSGGGGDHDCPYCGGGDTDGNHCYTCNDDF